VRQWAPILAIPGLPDNHRQRLRELLLRYIAHDRLPLRPNRYEPRAKKRRPKGYPLLTKPRRLFREIKHRNRYRKP
jgi:hypothetical protein